MADEVVWMDAWLTTHVMSAPGAERRDSYAQPPEDAEDSPQELAPKPTLGEHLPRPRRSLQHRRTQHLVIMELVPHASWMPSQSWG